MEALRDLPQRVETLAERWGVPGVAVAVDVAGQTTSICHGVTHVAHPLAVDEHTLFQVASNTKPFVATLVMALVEEGRLQLDDPIRRHLPDFATPQGKFDEAVTVRHLLSHRVGWDGDELFVRPPSLGTLASAPAAMARARQLVPPGTHFTYSNAAYSVAGRLVEVLEGQPFEACLRERLLEPLKMQRSCLSADDAIFHRVAMRHLSIPGRAPIPLAGGGWQPGWEIQAVDVPAAALITSAHDLLHWLRFWLGRGNASEKLPLSAATQSKALEEQVRVNPDSGQAIGWEIRYEEGARLYCHGGLTAGYCSFTLFVPELDLAALILTNSTSGVAVHRELSRFIVGQVSGIPGRDPKPLASPPSLERYTGHYWGSFGIIEIRALDDSRTLELSVERHSTDDGSWQPPPQGPIRLQLCDANHAVIQEPEEIRGALVDFDPEDSEQPAWLRSGGRIAVREGSGT